MAGGGSPAHRGLFFEWSCVVPPGQPIVLWKDCPVPDGTIVDLFVLESSTKAALAFTTLGTDRFRFAWCPSPSTGALHRLLEGVKVGCFLEVRQAWPPVVVQGIGGGTLTPDPAPSALSGVQVPLRLEEAVCYAQLDTAGVLTFATFTVWGLTPSGRWIQLAAGATAPVRVERPGALYERLYVQVTGGVGPADLVREIVPLQRESADPGLTIRLGAVVKGVGA